MKIAFSIAMLVFFSVNLNAQSRMISKDEYEKVFEFASSKTNADFPFVFTVITNFVENGKTVRTVTEVDERESQTHERIKRIDFFNGRETTKYLVRLGSGNVFCSDDERTWNSTQYECFGPVSFYGIRDVKSVEYSVAEESIGGKRVKVYREYSIFAPSKESKKKEFREKVSIIDSEGFFISVVDIEGTLEPKTITLVRKQYWSKAYIKPVVSPLKND